MERFTQEAFDEHSRQNPLLVLDDVLTRHVHQSPSPILFAYPRADREGGDGDYYETFTAAQLDGYVDAVVRHLVQSGHEPNLGRVVGMLGNPNLDWVVHLFALSRLGYCVVMMSLRQKAVGLASLLGSARGDAVVYDEATPDTADLVQGIVALQPPTSAIPFVPRSVYTAAAAVRNTSTPKPPRFFFPREKQTDTTAVFFSTSGSTGLPKPIPYRHDDMALSLFTSSLPLTSLLSWPSYHGWGLGILLGTMHAGKTCYVMDTGPELTPGALIEALEAARPEFLPAPPYNVGLIAQTPRGLACLQAAEYVTTGGARLPDELGKYLVEHGVNISTSLGSSEATRNFATSMWRARGDPEWDYVEIPPVLRPHILLDPVPGNAPLHEIVFLRSFPGLSHVEEGNVFRTGDMMRPHEDPRRDTWKFVCREGDFTALSTSMKVLGVPFEERLRASPLVEEAVVVGVGRTVPGLLVVPATREEEEEEEEEEEDGDDEDDGERFVERVWPLVEEANGVVPGHAEVSRDMVRVLPRTARLPRTDKGNVMRQRVYTEFASEIEGLYAEEKRG
ncbi:NRPS-like enzyme [Beauveria bassiana ARSEF 2860]|uniref:NRPS-like enzyme n=1 Tax=Beauveria bassiana (strain ARSEF 2860) TaxID=655819 RepID=J4UGQ6_BEAB2|nr:NRPS-like enzyme [Beauveria bassiana ARSEF 2860]EJP62122.1 NRPS-like enzyme [Beauveria bassiana ARSEF 2860]